MKYHEEYCPNNDPDWIDSDCIGFQEESIKSYDSNEESPVICKYTPPNYLQGTLGQQENEIDKDMLWVEGSANESSEIIDIPKFIQPPMYTPELLSMKNNGSNIRKESIAFSEFRPYGNYSK